MPPRTPRALAGLLVGLTLALSPLAAAAASPYAEYSERQRGDTLIIEHTPAPGIVVRNVRRKGRLVRHRVARRHLARRRVRHRLAARVRNVANPAIAGFCREGGAVLRRDPVRGERIIQREVCDSVAYYSQDPNDIAVRPPEYAAR